MLKDVTRVVSPERKEYVGDDWGCAALIVPIPVGIWFLIQSSWVVGVAGAVGAFVLMAFILYHAGSTWFRSEQTVPEVTATTNEQVAEHRCCIQCRHPAKVLR